MITMTTVTCLALNSYKEARSTSLEEQQLVNQVVIARSKKFNKDYCQIVFEKNQFSWTKGYKLKRSFKDVSSMLNYYNIDDKKSWATSVGVAYLTSTYVDKNVIFYHDKSIKNFKWDSGSTKGQIKTVLVTPNFIFYQLKDRPNV